MNGASTEFTGREGMSEAPSNWRVHIVYNFSGFKVEVNPRSTVPIGYLPKRIRMPSKGLPFRLRRCSGDGIKVVMGMRHVTAPVSVHGSSDAGLKVLR